MSKLNLNDVTAGFASASAVNTNNTAIEVAFENTLSRDGSGPNQMNANLDLNGYLLLNQGNPITISGFNWEGPWATGIDYIVGDVVEESGSAYIAIEAHTSGVFSDDFTSLRWQVVASANLPTQTGATNKFLQTDGSLSTWETPTSDVINHTVVKTAAVTLSLNDKLSEIISVKDFGAVGNGVTDDTAAFEAAVAATSGNIVHIVVPSGTYNIASSVNAKGKDIRYVADADTTFSSYENLNGGIQRSQRISRDLFGILDQAAGYAVMCNVADAGAQVNGFSTDSDLATYDDRDSVGLYVQNSAPALFFTTTGTTYTTTTLTSSTPAPVEKLKIGMIIDTLHSPKYSGRITSFTPDGLTITVSGWFKQGNTASGQLPANGTNAVINKLTKVWALNANATIEAYSDANKVTGFELGVVNNKFAWTLGSPNTSWGYDCNNLGAYRTEVAFVQRGDFFYGFSSRGAYRAGFHVEENTQVSEYGLLIESNVTNPVMFAPTGGQKFAVTQNGSVELGSESSSNTPFIDFHSSGLAADYDTRLMAEGGTSTNGQGKLNLFTKVLNFIGITTSTTAPSAGGAGALPATPLGYLVIQVNGVDRKVPYY